MTSSSVAAMVNFSEEIAHTSTTKALLLSVAVPRIYRVYLPPKQEEPEAATETKLTWKSTNLESVTEGKVVVVEIPDDEKEPKDVENKKVEKHEKPTDVTNEKDTKESDAEEEHVTVGYVEHDDGKSNKEKVEHVVTEEEMAAVVKVDPVQAKAITEEETKKKEEEKAKNKEEEKPKEEEKDEKQQNEAPATASSLMSEAFKTFFGVVKKEQTVYMNREEAMEALHRHHSRKHSKTHFPKNDEIIEANEEVLWNTEIKVESLLRIAFRNMYEEGHFYNAPVTTAIRSKDEEDWVEVTAMVKQDSTGVILERLEKYGLGSTVGTISIFKAELCRTAEFIPKASSKSETKEESAASKDESETIEAARVEWKNAASRLRVEQVKEQIHEQAQLSLDFLALLSIASVLAGIGLITDNTVVIVASMLVSPIMGPVMGMTFGSRVLDWSLAIEGARVEVLALLISVLIGGIIGISSSFCPVAEEWPTGEMTGRGDVTGLVTGIAIAIPSGMGVALSILGNNTSSLVGVAISASLLPPAVNAGICWVHAILIRAGAVENHSGEDFARIGGISFSLTVVNIVCIWIFGMLMFQIKEVAPSKSKSAFWAKDIKTARAIQKGTKEVDMEKLKTGLEDALEKERKNTEASRLPRRPRAGPYQKHFSFNLQENPVDDIAPLGDILPTPLTDDIRYVGLEDMGALLGFDDEDEDEEQPRPKRRWF